jgi:hypothetical protein
MTNTSYSNVVGALGAASMQVSQLGEGQGPKVAVTLAAGRVIAMAFSTEGPNLFWSNPELSNTELVKNHPEKLVGGLGGERLWFAPELAYHWDGEPDWKSFANYKVPAAADPGAYELLRKDSYSVTLHAQGELPVHGTDRRTRFEVERTIRLIDPPLSRSDPLMNRVDYVGIESSHVLKILPPTREGLIDLWHLLQVPAGSVLVVPVKRNEQAKPVQPLSYANPGGWVDARDHLSWRYEGQACAKIGLPAGALIGRSAVIQKLQGSRWCLIVRDFPVDANARYVDHPYKVPRTDQAFQAWDGFGFGEMEFHSPAADAARGPREIRESDRLWAFGGPGDAIAALARHLLNVDVEYLFAR